MWKIGLIFFWIQGFILCESETIRVTSILAYPYLMIKGNETESANDTTIASVTGGAEEVEEYEGFIKSFLDGMAEITGKEFEIHLVADGMYGSYDKETGTGTGMIGEIISGAADVAAAPLTVTLNREMGVDFLFPFQTHEASILMRKRHPQQEPSIKSLEDLVTQDVVKYGVLKDGSISKVIEQSQDELLQTMWANMTEKPYVFKETNQLGVNRARDDHFYAFILEGSMADLVASKPPCDLEVVKAGFFKRQYAFAVKNMSPLRDELNQAQVVLQNNGKMDEYFKEWFGENECSAAGKSRFTWITICFVLAAISFVA